MPQAGRLLNCSPRRTKQGLDVRLMYDAVGSLLTPASLFQPLYDAGVRVHAFHTLGEAFWRFRFFQLFNRRNHRKLTVIDESISYFGGMNIVDQSQVKSVEDEAPPQLAFFFRLRATSMSGWWGPDKVKLPPPWKSYGAVPNIDR